MPTLAIGLTTGLFGTADYPWTITVGSTVVDPDWPTLELEEDAYGESSYFRFRVWDEDVSLSIVERMPVWVQDNVSDEPVFLGYVLRRSFEAQARGRWIQVEAVSIGAMLDEILVPAEVRPVESDAARVGYLWGTYARQPLASDLTMVTEINASLPADVLVNLTLRTALDQTAALAGESVRWYVDAVGRLHWFSESEASLVAPYNINVALSPGGGNIAPDDINVEYDGKIVNRVYVRAANLDASDWYQNDASVLTYGTVEGYLDAPNADTAAKARSTALLYLGRVAAATARGTFTTGHPYTGWKAGQTITITSAQHDLSALATRIVRLRHRFALGDGKRIIEAEFGRPKARSTSSERATPLVDQGLGGQMVQGRLGTSGGTLSIGHANLQVDSAGVVVTDGSITRTRMGLLDSGDYGAVLIGSSGSTVFDGNKIQIGQSEGTVPAGVALGISQTAVTSSGVVVSSGGVDRVVIGALGGGDYGLTIANASSTVIIDGTSNMFKIAATGTLTTATATGPSGTALATVTLTGLAPAGVIPMHLAQVYRTSQNLRWGQYFGDNPGFRYVATTSGGAVTDQQVTTQAQGWLGAQLSGTDDLQLRLNWYNSVASAWAAAGRYYVLKEAGI